MAWSFPCAANYSCMWQAWHDPDAQQCIRRGRWTDAKACSSRGHWDLHFHSRLTWNILVSQPFQGPIYWWSQGNILIKCNLMWRFKVFHALKWLFIHVLHYYFLNFTSNFSFYRTIPFFDRVPSSSILQLTPDLSGSPVSQLRCYFQTITCKWQIPSSNSFWMDRSIPPISAGWSPCLKLPS